MNKKARNVLLLVILAVMCLLVFAACNKVPDINSDPADTLGIMGKLVRLMHEDWFGKGNYGWTVVVFTVFLKIITLPLTLWQQLAARKSSLKMQAMQPVIEDIDKRYGANTQRANEEKQKLYKKQGFSMLSSCLPMLITMVVFIVMFRGLTNYSTFSSIKNFKELSNTYYEVYYEQILDTDENGAYINGELAQAFNNRYEEVLKSAKEELNNDDELAKLKARIEAYYEAGSFNGKNDYAYNEVLANADQAAVKAVQDKFAENQESWLWIQNVWQPDTWAPIMQPYKTSAIGGAFSGNGFSTSVNLKGYPDRTDGELTYQIIRDSVLKTGGHGKNGTWNGFMILPFMSIGLSFLSMLTTQLMEKKNRKGKAVQQNAQQATTNKMMMIMMPLMMAYFGFIYTGAFAIYMVVNYTLSILTTIAMRWPVEKIVNRSINKADKNNKSNKATYMR